MDGMPVNFKLPIDDATLSGTDFEVIDLMGNRHTPICAVLAPANENGENRTVLLVGEFGIAGTNPPKEVRIVGDLFTLNKLPQESACAEVTNLKGASTTNIIPLADGPSLYFAQKIEGSINECGTGSQTIQVYWNGGIVPFIAGDTEADLFQYYTGYSESSGKLVAHKPIAIADINDNDNVHQLCFSTTSKIVKISIIANTVEDPNGDPNTDSETEVSYCANTLKLNFNTNPLEKEYRLYPNPSGIEFYIENMEGDESLTVHDFSGQKVLEGKPYETYSIANLPSGLYFITIKNKTGQKVMKLIKK